MVGCVRPASFPVCYLGVRDAAGERVQHRCRCVGLGLHGCSSRTSELTVNYSLLCVRHVLFVFFQSISMLTVFLVLAILNQVSKMQDR